MKSFEDDVDEDIEEDISVAEDLLRSDNSMVRMGYCHDVT